MSRACLLLLLVACGGGAATAPAVPAPEQAPAAGAASEEEAAATAAAIDPVDVHQRWRGAVDTGDWEAAQALLGDEATMVIGMAPLTLRGRESIAQFLVGAADGAAGRAPSASLVLVGERAVATLAVAPRLAANKRADTRWVTLEVLELDADGRIQALASFSEHLSVLGALGDDAQVVRSAPEDDSGVVRAWATVFQQHQPAALAALYAPDAVYDDSHLPAAATGRDAIAKAYAALVAGFPDLAIEPRIRLAAGPYHVLVYRLTGTHAGPYAPVGASGTMRQIELFGASVFRVQGGAIAEHSVFVDRVALALQLGAGDDTP